MYICICVYIYIIYILYIYYIYIYVCVCVCVQHIKEHLVLVSSRNGVREGGIALFVRSEVLRGSRDGVVVTCHAAISAEVLCRSAGAGHVVLIEHVDLSRFRV